MLITQSGSVSESPSGSFPSVSPTNPRLFTRILKLSCATLVASLRNLSSLHTLIPVFTGSGVGNAGASVKLNRDVASEVAGIGRVELQIQDLVHISLVIYEVDCFTYLGLNLDHALRWRRRQRRG